VSNWQEVTFDFPDALPFFIDLHLQGSAGVDLTQVETIDQVHQVSRTLKENGVGAYLPSLIAAPIEQLKKSISIIE